MARVGRGKEQQEHRWGDASGIRALARDSTGVGRAGLRLGSEGWLALQAQPQDQKDHGGVSGCRTGTLE